jgi:hypothetical protein
VRRNTKKRNETRHATADSYLERTMAERKRKLEEEGTAKSIPKKKQHRTRDIKGVSPDLRKDGDENSSCGLCGSKDCSVHSVQKGGWIRCRHCDTWYHEVCVGAVGTEQFICGNAGDYAA